MKSTDNYRAKIKLWVNAPCSCRLPKAEGFPSFQGKKFSSYAEMNAWKREYRKTIAAQGGLKWKS